MQGKKRHPTAAAVRNAERNLQAHPRALAVHQELAAAHAQLLRRRDHEAELAAVCRDLPFAFTSQLYLAAACEARGDLRGAVVGSLRAIKTARLRGFWHDDASTPPWLRDRVLHAMDLAARGKLEVYHHLFEALTARYGRDELTRVAKALAMYLGVEPVVLGDPRQRPTFLYLPGLPIAPVFPRSALPFADWYEAQAEAIAGDLRGVLDSADVQPFHYDVPEPTRGTLTHGAWDAYFFYKEGARIAAHHAACPNVSAALAQLPLDHVRDHGPEVCFSILRPGAHILPHRGVTNARAVLHLALEIPPDCALNLVGVAQVQWTAGRCVAFDDTYEHEAWNRSRATRVILLADIWNPYLRPAEREALAELVGFIGDFNRQAAPVPVTS